MRIKPVEQTVIFALQMYRNLRILQWREDHGICYAYFVNKHLTKGERI